MFQHLSAGSCAAPRSHGGAAGQYASGGTTAEGAWGGFLLFWQCCSAREVQGGGVHNNQNFRAAHPSLSSASLRLYDATPPGHQDRDWTALAFSLTNIFVYLPHHHHVWRCHKILTLILLYWGNLQLIQMQRTHGSIRAVIFMPLKKYRFIFLIRGA